MLRAECVKKIPYRITSVRDEYSRGTTLIPMYSEPRMYAGTFQNRLSGNTGSYFCITYSQTSVPTKACIVKLLITIQQVLYVTLLQIIHFKLKTVSDSEPLLRCEIEHIYEPDKACSR